MKKENRVFRLVFLFVLMATFFAKAQKTTIYVHPSAQLKEGIYLFEQQKFVSAQKVLQDAIPLFAPYSKERVDAEFYSAYCAYELFNEDTEPLLLEFIQNHPESNRSNLAVFLIGNYYYRNKQLKPALVWYEKTEPAKLNSTQRAELYFKKGYCYFMKEQYSKAKPLFAEIKDIENTYAAPATYYYSHIAYLEKKYETALEGFKKFSKNSTFGPIVPYYIAQIYFYQKKYDLVIEYGIPILDSTSTKRAPEIARLIGDSYYKTDRFEAAIPFLEKYIAGKGKMERPDFYEYGYVYYQTKNYDKGIEYFQKAISDQSDSLSQLSYYHIGDCYYKSSRKELARNSFGTASKMDFDLNVKEDALFNYAKLAYELESDPFHNAITAFKTYLQLYPKSDKYEEAFNFLVNAFLRSRNYTEALNALDEMPTKTLALKLAYQKLSYLKATEYFNNSKYNDAIAFYNKSMLYDKDKNLKGQSVYWKGESFFQINEIDSAIFCFKDFLFSAIAPSLDIYHVANYSLAYCYHSRKQYEQANNFFRKFIALAPKKEGKKITDAAIRVADGYFMNRDFAGALEYYTMAEEFNNFNVDYILYQKALVLGLYGKNDQKVITLTKLIDQHSKSSYVDDATFELAECYLIKNDNQKSLENFNKLIAAFPSSVLIKKAQMKVALIYRNTDQDDKALGAYQEIVTKYPNSTESNQALNSIRDIYVSEGRVEELEKFISSVPTLKFENSAIDSAMYESAELKYMKGDCEGSSKAFDTYINKFENAIFALKANYFKADCDYKKGNLIEALKGFEFVASKQSSSYTEKSVQLAAYINYKNKELTKALQYYQQLEKVSTGPVTLAESNVGQMRCNIKLGNFDEAIVAANKVQADEKSSNELVAESYLTKAKSYLKLKRDTLAIRELRNTVAKTKSEKSAEAKFLMAELYFNNADYENSKKQVDELLEQDPSYDFWVTKAYILYADIFYAKEDVFNAKETLQSVIDNSENNELVELSKSKLNAIIEAEKNKEEKYKQDALEIKFDTNSFKDNQLFEDENKE
jgi:tetratricopeptide (TPR) repeat protein